jgi:Druantia protein DruA
MQSPVLPQLAPIVAMTAYSLQKHAFLIAFAADLRRLQIVVSVRRRKAKLRFQAKLNDLHADAVLPLMRSERLRRLQQQQPLILRMTPDIRVMLADGASLDVDAIDPHLELCRTRRHFALFRFLSLLQSIPTTKLVYRQICFLVRDRGQATAPVMGIIGLSSPVYSLRCRDELYKWIGPHRRAVKHRGLNSSMQLSICMAIPPYDGLRVGRLLAALAASSDVAAIFEDRYGHNSDRLRAVIAMCGTGIHAPIFNRIMLKAGGLYRRIGSTSGYSTLFFSKTTMAAARIVAVHAGLDASATSHNISTLKRSLNACKIPRERFVRLGIPKGIYIATAGPDAEAYLRGTWRGRGLGWPTASEAVDYWRCRDLPKALADAANLTALRNFDPDALLKKLELA